MTKEELAKIIFAECEKEGEPVTVEESLEMAEMEMKAGNIKNYVSAPKEKRKSSPKTVKVSSEKTEIFSKIAEFLSKEYEICVETDNKLLKIYKNGKEFKLNLSETRQKKK